MKFKSRVDLWLAAIIWGTVIACFVPLFIEFDWILLIVAIGMLVFIGTLWFGTYYVIEDNELIISGGIARKKIPIAEITKLTKTNNPLSSPALSIKRMEVMYEPGMQIVLISPDEQRRFIELLLEKNPHIVVDPKLLA